MLKARVEQVKDHLCYTGVVVLSELLNLLTWGLRAEKARLVAIQMVH